MKRFVVEIVPEGSEDFDALERFEVRDQASADVIFGSPEQAQAEFISGKLNQWWDRHEERAEFRAAAAGVVSSGVL